MRGADQRQEVDIGPVRRGPPPFQQPRGPDQESAHAHRRYILRLSALTADEADGLIIGKGIGHAGTTRHTDQIERRTIGEGAIGHDAEPAVAHDGQHGLGGDMR